MDERRHAARHGDDENRYLSDGDVKAIALELKAAFLKDFYMDLGKGTWAVLWRGAAAVLGVIAAYGQLKSWGVLK